MDKAGNAELAAIENDFAQIVGRIAPEFPLFRPVKGTCRSAGGRFSLDQASGLELQGRLGHHGMPFVSDIGNDLCPAD